MAGRYPAAKIAEELRRAVTAVYVKASDLGISLQRKKPIEAENKPVGQRDVGRGPPLS
jgi:hypothetical protein